MNVTKLRLPISPEYDTPIFNAVAIQIIVGIVGLLNLDGGVMAQISGIALVAFWGGVVVLIWRHPQSPSRFDTAFIKFGYLPMILAAYYMVGWIWHMRGV